MLLQICHMVIPRQAFPLTDNLHMAYHIIPMHTYNQYLYDSGQKDQSNCI